MPFNHALKRNGIRLNRDFALACCLSMIFSENRYPPRVKPGAGLFGIMLDAAGRPPRLEALALAHIPAKWIPVRRKEHAQIKDG